MITHELVINMIKAMKLDNLPQPLAGFCLWIIDPLQDKVSSKTIIINGKKVNSALCDCPVYFDPDPPGEIRRRMGVVSGF